MYNRYVPRSDGSYQRNWVPDQQPSSRRSTKPAPPPPQTECHKPTPQHGTHPEPPKPLPPHRPEPVGNFLQQLLPRNFDTGDLIIVLLLLLLAGDCQEEQNHALLTLALYFLM